MYIVRISQDVPEGRTKTEIPFELGGERVKIVNRRDEKHVYRILYKRINNRV